MKFCEKCGGYMRTTKAGYVCSKCGYQLKTDVIDIVKIAPTEKPTDTVDAPSPEYMKIAATCPRCGHNEAFRSLGFMSGEHAGVRQERVMERLVCTKCGYSWSGE